MSADLAEFINPGAEAAYRHQLAAEMYRAGVEDGRRAGITETIGWYKRLLTNTVADARLERRRWHVCCKRCRLAGCRDGCTRCEDRDRGSYHLPHPDDHARGGTP